MNTKALLSVCSFAAALSLQAFEVQNVSARSRWPWNGLIDVDYEITGAKAGEAFAIDVNATYSNGVHKLVGRTYKSEPVAGPGQNRIVWDFGTDCPNVVAPDMRISVTATPFGDKTDVYCVIDVSGGKDAAKYPVRYTTTGPVHTPNCTTDVCKLTEIWLKRIRPAGRDFTVGNFRTPADDNESYYTRLTKDYYIGVFETTQQQWFQLAGTWPSQCSNVLWRATRPLDKFYTDLLYGSDGWKWPDSTTLKANCLLDKLRTKTGLATLNLPTEAQWQFAETAGPTKGSEIYRYRDPNGKEYAIGEIARYSGNSGDFQDGMGDLDNGSASVGCYKPNNFGLYDMLGNVGEDCVDPFAKNLKTYYQGKGASFPIVDPIGIPQDDAKASNGGDLRATTRTIGWRSSSEYNTIWYRSGARTSYSSDSSIASRGFRFCVTCE